MSEDKITDLEERLDILEREHAALSDRFKLYMDFFMGMLMSDLIESDIDTLREIIERKIDVARQTTQLDLLNDLQDLLHTFDAARPPFGPE